VRSIYGYRFNDYCTFTVFFYPNCTFAKQIYDSTFASVGCTVYDAGKTVLMNTTSGFFIVYSIH
jgi:hypothetical protein